ncbi:unnamed protein product [Lactuca virosa]|uniref:Retrotransposon gag domain-containing protein n=1 Tax=Lactuca virosa TaxID=75947 RepID=A0AAU9NWI1_9ASTR|nr:unnamed protein product [Lactuca virosa]
MWIYGTVTQSLLNMILKPGATDHTVWTDLETLFIENKQTREIELDQELRTLTLGDLSISDYCERMKVISDLLVNIGSSVTEQTLVTYLINVLSPNFDNIAIVLHHQDLFPSLLKCRPILTLEERTMSHNRSTQPLHMDHASSPQALHARNPNPSNSHNRPFPQNNRGGSRPSQPCRGGSHSTDNRRPFRTTTTIPLLPSGFPWPPYPAPWNPYTWSYPS